jgi:hypothetical protein
MNDSNHEYLTIRAGLALPALQAVVNGVFYGVAVAGLVGVSNHLAITDLPVLPVAVVVFSLSGLGKWRTLIEDWRVLLYGLGDIEVPGPETIPPVRVELASNNGRTVQFADLPIEPERLIALGAGLAEGVSFTEASWTGSGAPFSRTEFVRLRDVMVRRGLAAWNSPNDNARGLRVTSKGMAVMRHFAGMAASDSPTLFRTRR